MTSQRPSNEAPGGRPAKAEVGALVDHLRELPRKRRPAGEQAAGSGDDPRIAILERRVEHLEATLEALQDAVDRQTVLQDERIAELRKRTAPEHMARALSEDARRRGV
jgi:hypothetical protein